MAIRTHSFGISLGNVVFTNGVAAIGHNGVDMELRLLSDRSDCIWRRGLAALLAQLSTLPASLPLANVTDF